MSSDIDKHKRWLRDMGGRTNLEALSAIEALEAEVAAYSKLVEKEAAFGIAQMKRAKAAEARAERLREALKVIAADPTNSAQAMVARKALEDDKQ